MPRLQRPDGIEVHWEERGEGPLAVLVTAYSVPPGVFEGVLGDLATDHRVVVYHPRGVGESTRSGPYDCATDAADLEALVETAGSDAVAIALADGANRAVRVAAARPDLVSAVVTPVPVGLGARVLEGTSSLASPLVIDALVQQLRSDYRGATRMMVTSNNPQMSEEEIRARVAEAVEFCPQEAAVARLEAWIADEPLEQALMLGDRLWILHHPDSPWFPPDILPRVRELLPEAQVHEVAHGPLSRPDITAACVRLLSRRQAGSLSSERQR